jgi:hypothetical protein
MYGCVYVCMSVCVFVHVCACVPGGGWGGVTGAQDRFICIDLGTAVS